jgi:cytochrome c oxidase assembly factor CtaG
MWIWHVPALFDAPSPTAAVIGIQVLESLCVIGALILAAIFLPGLLKRASREGGYGVDRPSAGDPGARMSFSVVFGGGAILAIIALAALGALDPPAWGTNFEPHNPLHMLMDVLFIITAIIYWWPILSPVQAVPRISPLFGMLYMFISTMPMMVIGALLVFAPSPVFTRYAGAPLILGFTRLFDQQLAGLTMWLIMDIPIFITISILFFRWVNQQDLAERAAAGEFDEVFDPAPAPAPATQLEKPADVSRGAAETGVSFP